MYQIENDRNKELIVRARSAVNWFCEGTDNVS